MARGSGLGQGDHGREECAQADGAGGQPAVDPRQPAQASIALDHAATRRAAGAL
jgi:hypothetical protein